MKNQVIDKLKEIIKKMNVDIDVELTPSKGHGDFSTNIAMKLSSKLKDSPINIANKISKELIGGFIDNVEVASPGFINIFLKNDIFKNNIQEIIDKKNEFGKASQNKYINIEYVSANPTGFLHIGHARNAVLGSTLVNVLRFAGNKVDAEYYINDAGNQIKVLGESVRARYLQILGKEISMPKDSYAGEDIKLVANNIYNKHKGDFEDKDADEFGEIAKIMLLEIIREHLDKYNVVMDIYFSEKSLYENKLITPALEKLKDHIYEKDGAVFLDTTSHGDDKDRVLVKSDKTYTYLTPDIAYHKIKIDRGYDELINIWGADHIGYIKRMEVALGYLGLPKERLDILTVQLVKLFKDNKELKMSKRMGTTYTIIELLEEIGKDAARWFMIDRSNNSGFTFDINDAKKQSSENPVFSVQYTHARTHQLISKSSCEPKAGEYTEKEKEIINTLMKFPELVLRVANTHKAHLIPQYLLDLSNQFNSWYSNTKAIGSDNESSLIALAYAVQIVIKNGLELLGISSPIRM